MYENATHLQFRPYALDKGLKILRSQVAPILKQQSGLLSLALIPNRRTNQVTILSLWASQNAARLVEIRAEYRRAIQQLDPLLLPESQPAPSSHSMAHLPVGGRSLN